METKRCPMCNKYLPLEAFSKNKSRKDGLQSYCIECRKERYQKMYKEKVSDTGRIYREKNKEEIAIRSKIWRDNNKEKKRQTDQSYREKNKDKIKAQLKEYRIKNADKLKAYNAEHREERSEYNKKYRIEHLEEINKRTKAYREANKDLVREQRRISNQKHKDRIYAYRKEYNKMKMETDEMYRFKTKIRNFINKSFKRQNFTKNNGTFDLVGCNPQELKDYLYKTFYDNYGYEYDGKEDVHIDHIIPLATAETEDDVKRLCHYTNLQLLKPKDNMQKSDKIPLLTK